jgi:hypothetical protein
MPTKARFWTPPPRQPTFSMQSLWQLAVWGIAAATALALAAAASYSEAGSRRLMIALGDLNGTAQKEPIPGSTRARDSATDIAPLESVRVLAAERERLAARIGRIERQLDDLTGSIKAQTGTAPGETAHLSAQLPAEAAALSPAPATPSTHLPSRHAHRLSQAGADQKCCPAHRTDHPWMRPR